MCSPWVNRCKLVDTALRDVSSRGVDSPLVFVPAMELPDAYQLLGRYTVENGQVVVKIQIFQNDRMIDEFIRQGVEKELPALAEAILETARQRLHLPETSK